MIFSLLDTRRTRRSVVLGLVIILMAGCAAEEYIERPVGELYNEAVDALERGSYESAVELFQEVERQHPYSQWAARAQLMTAFAYYQNLDYPEAIEAFDRYIELHPGSESLDYAYYMRGLCHYEQIADVYRSQEGTESALASFEELVRRFPDSVYAVEARLRIDLLYESLAGHSLAVGRYYFRRQQYHAALRRFQEVVRRYQTTSQIPEALHRLVETFLALGLTHEAQRTLILLEHNFPNSRWYRDSHRLVTGETIEAPEDDQQDDRPIVWRLFDWLTSWARPPG